MFDRIKILYQNKKSYCANKNINIKYLSLEEFSIYKYNFRVDVKIGELYFHSHLVNPNFSPRCTQICHNKSRNFLLLISRLCARSKLKLVNLASPARI